MEDVRLTLIGLGLEAMALGLLQTGELPVWVPWLIVGIGFLVILYALTPFSVTGMRRLAMYLPVSPKKSTTTEWDVTITAKLRWDDAVGKPMVNALESNLKVWSIWAGLDIDVRNSGQNPQRVSELYIEIRSSRFPKRLIAIADAKSDGLTDVKDRRVEWLLPPVGPAETHYVRFERFWAEDDETMPQGSKQFGAIIVAELGRPDRAIRLQIGDDIWETTVSSVRRNEPQTTNGQEASEPPGGGSPDGA